MGARELFTVRKGGGGSLLFKGKSLMRLSGVIKVVQGKRNMGLAL